MSAAKFSLLEGSGLNDRLLLVSLAAGVVGRTVNTTVRGNKQEMTAIKEVLAASRHLQETLHKQGVKMSEVLESVRRKQAAATQFERVTGIPWLL